ncbi:hypothetical protein [Malonomonas rubra]|uniref:hypothetical protein n=1 Tax=Malonomonas rubra TaxID=57040 RepID=UPI0026EDB5F6|nr:hypothetical protein [Malonomonas rubra]
MAEEIIQCIDNWIGEFYSVEDVKQGYVEATDREGNQRQHSLVSISMGTIDLSQRQVGSAQQIVDVCSETKKLAKKRRGSNIVVDQRRQRSTERVIRQ